MCRERVLNREALIVYYVPTMRACLNCVHKSTWFSVSDMCHKLAALNRLQWWQFYILSYKIIYTDHKFFMK